jgi:hypothetical protein
VSWSVGAESYHQGLKGYFASLQAAFDDLTITRGIIIADGDYVACQTKISGTFAREFTHAPVGPRRPNGRPWCRAHEHFPLRRSGTPRRGMGADG